MSEANKNTNDKENNDLGSRLLKMHMQIGMMGIHDIPDIVNYIVGITNEVSDMSGKELIASSLELSMIIQNIINRCTILVSNLSEEGLKYLGSLLSIPALFGDFCRIYFKKTQSSKLFSAVSKCMDYIQDLKESTKSDGVHPMQLPITATLELSSRACLSMYFLAHVFSLDTIPLLASYINSLKECAIIVISELIQFAPVVLMSKGSAISPNALMIGLMSLHCIRTANKCLLDLMAHYERTIDIQLRTDPISACLTGVMNQYDSLYAGFNSIYQTFASNDNMLAPTKQLSAIIHSGDLTTSVAVIGQMLMIIGMSNPELQDLSNIGVGLLYSCYSLETHRIMRMANYVIFLPQAILSAATTQEVYLNMNHLQQPGSGDGKDKMKEYKENYKKYEKTFKSLEKLRLSSSDAEKIRKNVLHLIEVSWINVAKLFSSVFIYAKSLRANSNINSNSNIQGISLGLSSSSILGVTHMGTIIHNHWSLVGLMASKIAEMIFIIQGYSKSVAQILRGENETLGTFFEKYTLTKTYPTKYTDGITITYPATQKGNLKGIEEDMCKLFNNVVFFGSSSVFQNMAKNLTIIGLSNKESLPSELIMGCYNEHYASRTLQKLPEDGMLKLHMSDDWIKGKYFKNDINPLLTDYIKQMDYVTLETDGGKSEQMQSLSMCYSAYFLKWVSSCGELVSSGGMISNLESSSQKSGDEIGGNKGTSSSRSMQKTKGTLFDEYCQFMMSLIASTKFTNPVPFVSSIYSYITRFGMVPSVSMSIIKYVSRSKYLSETIELLFKFGNVVTKSTGVKDMEKENELSESKNGKNINQKFGKVGEDVDYSSLDSNQKSMHRIGLRKISLIPTRVRAAMVMQLLRNAMNGLNKTEKETSLKIIQGCLISLLEMPVNGQISIEASKQISLTTLQTLIGVMITLSKSKALTKDIFLHGITCLSLLVSYLYKCSQAIKDINQDNTEKSEEQQQKRQTRKANAKKNKKRNTKNEDDDGFNFDLSDDDFGEGLKADKVSKELIDSVEKFSKITVKTPYKLLMEEFEKADKDCKLVLLAPLLISTMYDEDEKIEFNNILIKENIDVSFVTEELHHLMLLVSGERNTGNKFSHSDIAEGCRDIIDLLRDIPHVIDRMFNINYTPSLMRSAINDSVQIIRFLIQKDITPMSLKKLMGAMANQDISRNISASDIWNCSISNYFDGFSLSRTDEIMNIMLVCSYILSEVQKDPSASLVEYFSHFVHSKIPLEGLPLYVTGLVNSSPGDGFQARLYLKSLLCDAIAMGSRRLEAKYFINPGEDIKIINVNEKSKLNIEISAFITAIRIVLEFFSEDNSVLLPFLTHTYTILSKFKMILKENGIDNLVLDVDKTQLSLLSHAIILSKASSVNSFVDLNAVSVIRINNSLISNNRQTMDDENAPLYVPNVYQNLDISPSMMKYVTRFSSLEPFAICHIKDISRISIATTLYLQRFCLWNAMYVGALSLLNHPCSNISIALYDCLMRSLTVGKIFDESKNPNSESISKAVGIPELQKILEDDYNKRLISLGEIKGAGNPESNGTKILCMGISGHPFCRMNEMALQCIWEQMYTDNTPTSINELLETISLSSEILDDVVIYRGENDMVNKEKILRSLLSSISSHQTINIFALSQYLLDAFKKNNIKPLISSYNQAELSSFPRQLTEYAFVVLNSSGSSQKKQKNRYGDDNDGFDKSDSDASNEDQYNRGGRSGVKGSNTKGNIIQSDEDKWANLYDAVRFDVNGITESMEQLTTITMFEFIMRLSDDSQISKSSIFSYLASLPSSKSQVIITKIFSSILTTEMSLDICKAIGIMLDFSRGVGDPGDETFNLLEEEYIGIVTYLKEGLVNHNVYLANESMKLLIRLCRWDVCCRSEKLLKMTTTEMLELIDVAGPRLMEGICIGFVEVFKDCIYDYNDLSEDKIAADYTNWLITEVLSHGSWIIEYIPQLLKKYQQLPDDNNGECSLSNKFKNNTPIISKRTITEFLTYLMILNEKELVAGSINDVLLLCAVSTYNIYTYNIGACKSKPLYISSLILLKNILKDIFEFANNHLNENIPGTKYMVRGVTKLSLGIQPLNGDDPDSLKINEARGLLLQELAKYLDKDEDDADPQELIDADKDGDDLDGNRFVNPTNNTFFEDNDNNNDNINNKFFQDGMSADLEFQNPVNNDEFGFGETFEAFGNEKTTQFVNAEPFKNTEKDPFEINNEYNDWDDFGNWDNDTQDKNNDMFSNKNGSNKPFGTVNDQWNMKDMSNLSTALKIKLDTARHSDFGTLIKMYNEEYEKLSGNDEGNNNVSELLFTEVLSRIESIVNILKNGSTQNISGVEMMEIPVVCDESLKDIKQMEQSVKKMKNIAQSLNSSAGVKLKDNMSALIDSILEYTTSLLWFYQTKRNKATEMFGEVPIVTDCFTRANLPKDVTTPSGDNISIRQLYDDCISSIDQVIVIVETLVSCDDEFYDKLLNKFGLLSNITSTDLEEYARIISGVRTKVESNSGEEKNNKISDETGNNGNNNLDGDGWGDFGNDGFVDNGNGDGAADWDDDWGNGGFEEAKEVSDKNVGNVENKASSKEEIAEDKEGFENVEEENNEEKGKAAEQENSVVEGEKQVVDDNVQNEEEGQKEQKEENMFDDDIDEDDINNFFGEEVIVSSKSMNPSSKLSNTTTNQGGFSTYNNATNDFFDDTFDEYYDGFGNDKNYNFVQNNTNTIGDFTTVNDTKEEKEETTKPFLHLGNENISNIPLSISTSLLALNNVTKMMKPTIQQLLTLSLLMVRTCGFTCKPEHTPLVLMSFEKFGKISDMMQRQGPQLSDKFAASITVAIEKASLCFSAEHRSTNHSVNPLIVLTVLEAFLPICVRHEMDNYDDEESFDPSELAVEFCKSVLAAYPNIGRIYAERSPTNTQYVQVALSNQETEQPRKAFFSK